MSCEAARPGPCALTYGAGSAPDVRARPSADQERVTNVIWESHPR